MKKVLALLLTLTLLLPTLVSCSEKGQTDADETQNTNNSIASPPPAGETDTIAAEEPEEVTDNLPERNYGDIDFNICSRSTTAHIAYCAEEMTGETVNDALYERNERVGNRFGVRFTEVIYTDQNMPITLVTSGDSTYSMMNVRCNISETMAQKKMCYDIQSLEFIDLTKPYWDIEVSRQINIGDELFTVIGSANLAAIDLLTALLFNKRLAEQYEIGNLYDMVREGKWTFDSFGECAALVADDIDGDGVYTAADQWGVVGTSKYLHCSFFPAANTWYIEKDADNYPVFAMQNERFYDVFEKIFSVLNDNGAWYKTSDQTNESTESRQIFHEGRSLFYGHQVYFIESMRDMEDDFGILPYPKYDEAQEHYYSRLCFYDASVIPVSAEDAEMSSIILEALTCDSFNNLIPIYKESILKSKYARDSDSSEMIDILFSNRIADMGDTIYCGDIRDGIMSGMFASDDHNIASKAESKKKFMEKQLERMLKARNE